MRRNIFTYGSLMFSAVWEQVVHGRYRSGKAALEGHARFAIVDASYPGMVAQPGATVEGILYLDVDAADVVRLDAFEGSEYRRIIVQVHLPNGKSTDAQTYLYTLPQRLQNAAWDADAFDIERFLQDYCSSR